jgi:hypothetical protein
MIFMSQSGLSDPAREAEWDAWYVAHLRIMLTVPGIGSAQRFKTVGPGHSPSLAMYSIASADVFADPYYQRVRGMGEWLPLIDRRHYRRNLFAGLDAAPDVGEDAILLVVDSERPGPVGGVELAWLEAVGLDRSTPYRGVAVVERTAAGALAGPGVAAYRPVTPRTQASYS